MKTSLLDLLENTEIRSTSQLAEAMSTTVDIIEAKLSHYEKLGLVKRTVMNSSGCGGNCSKCKGCGTKKNKVPVVFWEKIYK